MSCPSCTSGIQVEFPAEMVFHFPGLRNIDRPCVFVFPTVLVCLQCGFCQFTIEQAELATLSSPGPEPEPART
jgi:hypothetical protein